VRLEDGSVRILHEIVARVAAFEDRPALLSGAVQDISELRAAERGLRQAVESLRLRNRELQEFAFVASHDLQEPLRKIRTFADRLQHRSSVLSDPAALHDTERMTAAAARMQRLIEDLLAFSRVSQSTPNMCEVNLDHVLAAVLDDLSEVIQQRAARIDSSPLPTLRADATQMRQLLQNLLSNALKFTSPERAPHIRLSASMQLVDSQLVWTLVCEDNGIGFDLKHAERIFTPFQRLHGREVFEGTGIGLAIVRRIVERHGGSVAAHGQPGVGACFTVVLPQGSTQLSE
jgi:light-regulated signal transduction histidine kinase (bacteriophytochrome)